MLLVLSVLVSALGLSELELLDLTSLNLELSLASIKVLEEVLGLSVRVALVDQNNLFLGHGLSIVDWELSEDSIRSVDGLVISLLVDKSGSGKLSGLELEGLLIDCNSPLLALLGVEEFVDHLYNGVNFLVGILSSLSEEGSHVSSVLSDGIGNTIDDTELRRNVDGLSLLHHDKHRLVLVSDLEVILLVEVLSNGDLGFVLHGEEGLAGTHIELDVSNNVSHLLTVVGNNGLVYELFLTPVLELSFEVLTSKLGLGLISFLNAIIGVVDFIEYSLSRHESAAVINNKGAARLVSVG